MAKHGVVGGVWAILLAGGMLPGGPGMAAEEARTVSKPVVRAVGILGNTWAAAEQIKTYLQMQPGKEYTPALVEADLRTLYAYYRSYGYLDVIIAMETQRAMEGSEVALIIRIQEGPRYRVADGCLHEASNTSKGKDRPPEACEGVPQRIKEFWQALQTLGHVEIVPVSSPDQLRLVSTRSKDQEIPCRIGTIRVTGNQRISSESILAHVPLVPDQVLFFTDLNQAEQNLAELGLFVVDTTTGVRPTITVIDREGDSARKDLLITVKEKTKPRSQRP